METLSLPQARRIALAAQGFAVPRPRSANLGALMRAVERTGVLQIDSVNVLQRAHYLPLFSRMGAYDTDLLRRASEETPRRLVEYWAHVAAFMPVEVWPLMQHRMRHHREKGHEWTGQLSDPRLAASLLAELAERGPSTARQLDAGLPRVKDQWGWNWSDTKVALEYLFAAGEVAVAGRTASFERRYDLPERVLPAEILAGPTPSDDEAHRELVLRAATSLGVGTEQCLRDYYRMGPAATRAAIATLVEEGELLPARVDGWSRTAYLRAGARRPRRVEARTLLSPFDPVVRERARTEALFGFRYRIEIYVPAAKRLHGYYVLPFLLGERLVARVDLKADRASGVLVVRAAYAEPNAPEETAEELRAVLEELAGWLGLDQVRVEQRGDLAPRLAA